MSTRREYNHAHQTQVTMNIARERNRTRASARSVSPRVGCDVISCPNQRGEMCKLRGSHVQKLVFKIEYFRHVYFKNVLLYGLGHYIMIINICLSFCQKALNG